MSLSPPASPVVVAHRGASAYAPEHTLPAFEQAVEMGADYLEQDLQMTADGILVVLHDPTLDRTARGPIPLCTGPVRERTLAELRECDFGSWFNEANPERAKPEFAGLALLTLEELFQHFGDRVRYYIETKDPELNPGMEEALVRLLERYGLLEGVDRTERVLIQSFSEVSLMRVRDLDPRLPLIQLAGRAEPAFPRMDRIAEYAMGVGPSHGQVDEAFMARAGGLGLMVHPYTVNDETRMQELLGLGVHGMFTDYPDLLMRVIQND